MTYEIDSQALSTAESGSTEREGCDMTTTSEQRAHVLVMVGYLEEMDIYVYFIEHVKEQKAYSDSHVCPSVTRSN